MQTITESLHNFQKESSTAVNSIHSTMHPKKNKGTEMELMNLKKKTKSIPVTEDVYHMLTYKVQNVSHINNDLVWL